MPTLDITGPMVAELRAAAGLTQRETAQVLGVHEQTIREWEKGRKQPRGLSYKAILRWRRSLQRAGKLPADAS